MVQRVTYRRKHSYNTNSNHIKQVRTPGGKLIVHYYKKKAQGPHCGDCKVRLQGVPSLRPKEYKKIPKNERTVARAYGGSRCHLCVKQRIVRAFLIDEVKCIKNIKKDKEEAPKK